MGFEKEERIRLVSKELEDMNSRLSDYELELINKTEEINFFKDEK